MTNDVFKKHPGREGYPSFSKFTRNLLSGLNYRDLHNWLREHIDLYTCEKSLCMKEIQVPECFVNMLRNNLQEMQQKVSFCTLSLTSGQHRPHKMVQNITVLDFLGH